ncbi:MAG: ParA family protein, partial [Gammaproteobacteria bacterium]|nr:ParA family protein [Gammaproteobacteria bacterium]
MYVTTFYSFKGGVGRTMALVNVAVDLVQRGRRVLLVDFDLEAPGLDTFDLGSPPHRTPGLVDFVSAYLATGQAPDVTRFVFRTPGMGESSGSLWIMPAGAHDDGYANTLSRIDWGELYRKHDGYFLFEDLREQWKASINPDYVLIDSRTGHTDVGGICTRQLPDSVVILFFPNAQNLRGLKKVVRDIRSETDRTRDRLIDLHFVMSNVPDLDDEDRILEENLQAFRQELRLSRSPMVIHRYDSLSLLNQVIFTKERPRSRLAKEYGGVTREIIQLNPADRDGALDYVRHTRRMRRFPGRRGLTGSEKHLDAIRTNHGNDGEVLYHLGLLRRDEGNPAGANTLLTQAIEAGYVEPAVFLARALVRRSELSDPDGASRDAARVLNSDRASPTQVKRAISMVAPGGLADAADAPALAALDDDAQAWIAGRISRTPEEAFAARNMLQPLLAAGSLSQDARTNARRALALASIALGRFDEAIQAIRTEAAEI